MVKGHKCLCKRKCFLGSESLLHSAHFYLGHIAVIYLYKQKMLANLKTTYIYILKPSNPPLLTTYFFGVYMSFYHMRADNPDWYDSGINKKKSKCLTINELITCIDFSLCYTLFFSK